jgi:hypothetical protein
MGEPRNESVTEPRRCFQPSAKLKAFIQQAADWAIDEERHQRHAALFVMHSRGDGKTITIPVPIEEMRDNLAEAKRVAEAAAATADVDAVVIGCWGPLDIKGQKKNGLILMAHERGWANGLTYFQLVRRWFGRVWAAGAPLFYGSGFTLAPYTPKRPRQSAWAILEQEGSSVTYSVTREDMARAIELFATNPALRDYWKALETVGWLSALPEREHGALRARLMKAHANNPAAIHEGLSAIESIGILMTDQDTDEDPGSVAFLASDYKAASFGAVTLERIRSKYHDPDWEEGEEHGEVECDPDFVVVRISFELRGRTVRMEVPFGEPLEPVRKAVNGILAKDGEPRRIFHVPAPDRAIGFVFLPPEVYDAATKLGLLPSDSSLD